MSFSTITAELRMELGSNMPQIRVLLKKNPAMAFTAINETASKVGKKHGIVLSLNFPQRGKIEDFESYGTENVGMVFQQNSRNFSIARDLIKSKAAEILDKPLVQDAYMYEGKEGVRVMLENARLDILPASLHVWGKFDYNISKFCDWLLINCYQLRPGVDGALSETNSKL
ncbi:MAG: hypothetical protein ACREBI_00835 [Nitrosotalea sp.]